MMDLGAAYTTAASLFPAVSAARRTDADITHFLFTSGK